MLEPGAALGCCSWLLLLAAVLACFWLLLHLDCCWLAAAPGLLLAAGCLLLLAGYCTWLLLAAPGCY